jgi:hypothetical protein
LALTSYEKHLPNRVAARHWETPHGVAPRQARNELSHKKLLDEGLTASQLYPV